MLSSAQQPASPFKIFPWFICSIGMLFYCYNYFLRVSPSVMENDLMQNLHITASQFGNLAAFYYYAYTPMQIPVGMIYDRFGARLVLFFACLVTVLGLALFIAANDLVSAGAGRFLIGFGTAFAYIGVLKLASIWLAPNRFATVAGLTTAFGMASAIFSDLYLTRFVQILGYKNALYTSLVVGVALSLFILFFMKNKPQEDTSGLTKISPKPITMKELFAALRTVLLNKQMWLIGLIGCLFYLPASVFLDLWGISYLKTVYQLSPEQAASVVSMTFVGWIIAGPSIGALSDYIKRRRLPLLIASVMAAVCLSVVFYAPGITVNQLYILFFLIGIFCGAHPLCFALGKENSPQSISGTAVAVTNTLIMLGGVFFQPIVGKILDWHSDGIMNNGNLVYSSADYTYALSVIPLALILSIFLTFFLRETHCQSQQEKSSDTSNVFKLQVNTAN